MRLLRLPAWWHGRGRRWRCPCEACPWWWSCPPTRHADDGPGGMAPTPLPEAQEELLAVVVLGAQHGAPALARGVEHDQRARRPRDDGTRTVHDRPGEIGIAVHLLAFEGDEDRAGLDGARVDDDLASYGRGERRRGGGPRSLRESPAWLGRSSVLLGGRGRGRDVQVGHGLGHDVHREERRGESFAR